MRCAAWKAGMRCASVRCEMKVSLMVCCFCPPCPPCATRPSNGAISARYTTHFVSHRSPPLPHLLAPPVRLTGESPLGHESLSPPCSGPTYLSLSICLSVCLSLGLQVSRPRSPLYCWPCGFLHRLPCWSACMHACTGSPIVGESRADAGQTEMLGRGLVVRVNPDLVDRAVQDAHPAGQVLAM